MHEDKVPTQEIPDDGIIVYSDIETIEGAAAKLLVTYDKLILSQDGCLRDFDGPPAEGETLIFREKIDLLPAEVVCLYLGDGQWYIFVTYEVPESGFPTTRDAMRVAESEERKMRILQEHLAKSEQTKMTTVTDWTPDRREDAARILSIISDVKGRFDRCI